MNRRRCAVEASNFDYEHWLMIARRYSRRRDEAADLLHDSLLDAIRAGRSNFAEEPTQRWFAGVLRNRAAMTARSAARRTRREECTSRDAATNGGSPPAPPPPDFLQSLPRAARSV